MTLTIKIEMENEAFGEDQVARLEEVKKIFAGLLKRWEPESFIPDTDTYDSRGNVRDTNGNTVGEWSVTD